MTDRKIYVNKEGTQSFEGRRLVFADAQNQRLKDLKKDFEANMYLLTAKEESHYKQLIKNYESLLASFS